MSTRPPRRTVAAVTGVRGPLRTFALGLTLALLVTLLPVEPVVAQAAPPDVVTETVRGVAEQAGGVAQAQGGGGRSEVIEAPIAFTGLGIKGSGPEPELRLRTRGLDGEWSPWIDVELLDASDGPDPDTPEHARAASVRGNGGWTSEAIWAGEASHAQIEVDRGRVGDVEVTFIDAMGLSETRVQRIGRKLRSLGSVSSKAAEAAGRPGIITRAQWGADEKLRKGSPSYATVRFAVLHHTAGSNTYTREQAAGQVRGIYAWHTQGNGWADIGYNLLVDRFGRIYEGRFGGLDRGVVGAHAAGWNSGSFGIALMGNHESVAPTSASVGALTDAIAWKYGVHGLDPDPSARVATHGRSIPTLIGHRDVGQTSCPGKYVAQQMDGIRRSVSKKSATASTATSTGWVPVTGDWNGDGRETGGWYRDGRWRLSNRTNNKATVNYRFAFGTAGDVPVVGDWNNDGTDTVGVFRDGRWYLRYSNNKGPADASFSYGRAGDSPVSGDFNGNGQDTVGVVRNGTWYLRLWAGKGPANLRFSYGLASDVPVVGNWDGVAIPGRGADGIGVRRGKRWILRNDPAGSGSDLSFTFGTASDAAVVADWNGPHAPVGVRAQQSGIGVVRGTDWYVRRDAAGGAPHATFRFGPS